MLLAMLRHLSVPLILALVLGGWAHGVGTGGGGGGGGGGQPGVYYVAVGGSDGNDGQTLANAWASPNHALNCGDVVHMQAGTYNAANFAAGQWGTVSNCPSVTTGSYFATLICDGCLWAGDGTTLYHHIAFIDTYAKNCGAGVQSNKVDYVAYVGLLTYGGDVVGQCVKGYQQWHPVNIDTFSGTHNFTAAAFIFNTVSTAGCGDALLLLGWDHLDDTSIPYTGIGAVEQSLIIGNSSWCVVPHQVSALLFIDHVSCWGNVRGADRTLNSELILSSTGATTVTNSIFQATISQTAGSTGTPACATTSNGAVFG